jgi:hypothetical protein
VLLCLLRSGISVVLLVALYYLLPLDRAVGPLTVVGLVLGLLVFCAVVAFQAYAVMRSDQPRLRALEALCSSVPLFLLVFATVYFLVDRSAPHSFTERLSRTDALYFTVTVFATVGFGDIAPVTAAARVLATVQMLGDLVVIGVVAKALLGAAVQVGLRRRGPGPGGGPGP